MWICGEYEFASTFSYRIPNFSTSYAASSIAPSPSTIKLSIIANVLTKTRNLGLAKEIFDSIKTAEIKIQPAKRTTIFRAFVKRLKKRREGGLDRTFGIREYGVLDSPISIFINFEEKIVDYVKSALKQISYFGTSDSICFCSSLSMKDPPLKTTSRKIDGSTSDGILFLLTDFTEEAEFDNVNVYSKTSNLVMGKQIVQEPYLFPVKIVEQGKVHTCYELAPFP